MLPERQITVTAHTLSSSEIGLRITNTAKEGADRDIWFMVQYDSGEVRRFTQGHVIYGQAVDYVEAKIKADTTYCYVVWARDDSETGCRSKEPSGSVCARTNK
jgi:hypothetical protein